MVELFKNTWRSHKYRVKFTSTCQAEKIAMNDVCVELVLLDKGIRDMIGITMYPISIRCDNKSAVNCTQMNGWNKLKTFDDVTKEVKRKLVIREQTGKKVSTWKLKVSTSKEHGNYVKICVQEKRVKVTCVFTHEHFSDIITKLLPRDTDSLFSEKIMNTN